MNPPGHFVTASEWPAVTGYLNGDSKCRLIGSVARSFCFRVLRGKDPLRLLGWLDPERG